MKEIESKAWVLESDKKKVLDFLQNSTNINALQNGEKIVKKDIMYTQLESANTSKKKNCISFTRRIWKILGYKKKQKLYRFWNRSKFRNRI